MKLKNLALLLVLSANAATHQICYESKSVNDFDFNTSLLLPQFHPGIGTLTQISLSAEVITTQTLKGENAATTPKKLILLTTNTVAISSLANVTRFSVVSFGTTNTMSVYDGHYDWAGTSGFTRVQTTTNNIPIPVVDVGVMVGYGNAVFSLIGTSANAVNPPSQFWTYGISATSSVRMVVCYTYDDGCP